MEAGREKYGRLSVPELKVLLRECGATLRGKKKDLIERLIFYESNNNFSSEPPVSVLHTDEEMVTANNLITPDINTYRDINTNSELSTLSISNIQNYLDRFNIGLESGRRMYEDRFLLSVRVAMSGEHFFLQSRCKASMKKSVIYIAQIQVTSTGIIEGCQCDCAVGESPDAHCKHVVASLLAVEHLKREGKIILNATCTERLQNFHKPKKQYFGSPLKVKNLQHGAINAINFKPFKHEVDPIKYRERVHNLCINYVSRSGSTMPFKYMIPPANLYAVISDHNYSLNGEEEMLKALKVLDVSDEYVKEIECCTREQEKNERWRDERRCRITASNFYSCCNAVSHDAKNNLAQRIINPQEFKTKQTQHGKDCEPRAIAAYESYGINVTKCGLFIMKTKPWLGASPDGLIGNETVLEVKCPYNQRNCAISGDTIPFLYEDDSGMLRVVPNHSYYYQIQGQLMVTGRKYSTLLVYTFTDWRLIDVPRDDRFILELETKLTVFYDNYLKPALLEKHLYKNYAKYFRHFSQKHLL